MNYYQSSPGPEGGPRQDRPLDSWELPCHQTSPAAGIPPTGQAPPRRKRRGLFVLALFIVLILATVLAVVLNLPGALWLPVLAFEVVLVKKRQPLVVGGTLLTALLLHVPPLLVGVLVGLFLLGALYLALPDLGKKK